MSVLRFVHTHREEPKRMPKADLGWHIISGETLLAALREAHQGTSPDIVFLELWANCSEHQDFREEDEE